MSIEDEIIRMESEGWEIVDEDGGPLWEIHRGIRYGQKILDVRISERKRFLWVKIGENHGQE